MAGSNVVKVDPQEANTNADDTIESAEENVCNQRTKYDVVKWEDLYKQINKG